MSRELDHRRARVARVLSKRPEPTVTVTYAPRPGTREDLVKE